MAAALTRQEVEKVSLLGRLRLTDEELDRMTEQLGQIVGYMALLAELDTDQVAPMAHAVEIANVFRADEVRPSLDRKDALANAPHQDGEFYLVPAVLGE
jgi:aspartyl-tRNA(Asn)/glutamyl-tRNA(Gln) amidotransferase subunit C